MKENNREAPIDFCLSTQRISAKGFNNKFYAPHTHTHIREEKGYNDVKIHWALGGSRKEGREKFE